MKMYSKKSKQNLSVTIDVAWEFPSDPRNLKVITPEYMGFFIESGADRSMFPGQIIHYIIAPLFGIKIKWISEITYLQPKHYFVDEQRYGPYAFWHHKHFIREIPGGIEMEDIIDYKIPFGFIGQIMHPILIKPKLDEIFEYRRQKLAELFGTF